MMTLANPIFSSSVSSELSFISPSFPGVITSEELDNHSPSFPACGMATSIGGSLLLLLSIFVEVNLVIQKNNVHSLRTRDIPDPSPDTVSTYVDARVIRHDGDRTFLLRCPR